MRRHIAGNRGGEEETEQGWAAEEILRHFYPQTTIEQL